MTLMRSNRWLILIVLVLTTTACNTVKGLGKDLEKAGESIQKSADNQKKD